MIASQLIKEEKMSKRIISLLCALVMLLGVFYGSFAEVVNDDDNITPLRMEMSRPHDAEVFQPLKAEMELVSEVEALRDQISVELGLVEVTEDKVDGKFAMKITAYENPGQDGFEYILAPSDYFDIFTYSRVTLWVKPAAGAQWIEFYTNDAKVISDKNGDGKFKIGEELISGQWNAITLDLTMNTSNNLEGKGLKVRTNDMSTWIFDSIKNPKLLVSEVDLTQFINSSTEVTNGSLKFLKNEVSAFNATPQVLLRADNSVSNSVNGNAKLSQINIESNYITVSNTPVEPKTTNILIASGQTGVRNRIFDLSDDGTVLFFSRSTDEDKIYKCIVGTKSLEKMADTVNVTDISTNSDGSKLFIRVNDSALFLKDVTSAALPVTLSAALPANSIFFSHAVNDLADYGLATRTEILKWDDAHEEQILNYYSYALYSMVTGSKYNLMTSQANGSILKKFAYAFPKSSKILYYSNNNLLSKLERMPTGNILTTLSTLPTNVTGIYPNALGDLLYLSLDGTSEGFYLFDVQSKALRKLDLEYKIRNVIKVLDDNRVALIDTYSRFIIYDPVENTSKIITPALATMGATSKYDITSDGRFMVFARSSSIYSQYLDADMSPERYLLSFDEKNTWHTYKNGKWEIVCTGRAPSEAETKEQGMSIAEVNALREADFSPLYNNHRQIYSVDFAIYFASLDANTSPNLKSIRIVSNQSVYDINNALMGQAVYVARELDYDADDWREISKLYPVEISPKESSFYYFIKVDDLYLSYDNYGWVEYTSEEITPILDDIEMHWSEVLLRGITAQTLKTIPDYMLTDKLAGKYFTIVYCMKVMDKSTEKYSSRVIVDYIENLFSSNDLVLKITSNSGSVKEYTGLNKLQVEEFMTWLQRRQQNVGPIFYTIKVDNNYYFFNYYMIQAVSVDEL